MSRATSKDGSPRMRVKARRRRLAKEEVPVEREGARARLPEEELIVTDGPFTEAKELVLSSR